MKYPWMPLFLGDLLADTLHLSAQEFGAYILLILHAWEHEARVHYKDARRVARVRADHWSKVFRALEPFFEWEKDPRQGSPTWGTHHRVHRELLKASEISNKRKGAAEQMHAKRRASAHPPSPSPLLESSNGKSMQPSAVQMHTDWRDKGVDYRAPPAKKSDNDLTDPNRPDVKTLLAKP